MWKIDEKIDRRFIWMGRIDKVGDELLAIQG